MRAEIRHPIRALDGISLDVMPGGVCAIVGPNGAGKTTAFRILMGLTTPTSGSATVSGFDVVQHSVSVRRLVGWMPAEDRSLFMRVSCAENLRFHGRLQGLKGRGLERQIMETLEIVGLSQVANNSVFSLSAGMRARLRLARALLHRPRLLILDEPTASIDPVSAHELMDLIISVVQEHQLAALISSHRIEEIEAIRDQVVLMHNGRILFEGPLAAFRSRFDRVRVEFEFRTSDHAVLAESLVKVAGIADRVSREGSIVWCAPVPPNGTGDLLLQLNSIAGDLLHVREEQLPLRELLAEAYRSDEGRGSPPPGGRRRSGDMAGGHRNLQRRSR